MQQNEQLACTIIFNVAPESAEFSLSEGMALFEMFGIPYKKLFEKYFPEDDFPARYDITAKSLPTFPYIDVILPNREIVQEVLSRSILIHDILYTLARSDSLDTLHENLLPCASEYLFDDKLSCKVDVVSTGKKITQESRVQVINHVFGLLKCTNQIDLSNPDITYYVFLTKKNQYVLAYSFQKKYKRRERNFARHFELPNRIYLGPVSLAHDLAFLMANQAKIQQMDDVIDPFSGTAGSLVACTYFGAQCYGAEIDGYLLQGHSIGQLNVKSSFYSEELIKKKPYVNLNFDQYNLPHPQLIRTDVNYRNYSKTAFGFFDALICDPPYGIRAAIQDINNEKNNKTANRTAIYKQMFVVARQLLRRGGRLVYLYPIWKETMERIQSEEGFELIDYREQQLADKRSRYLVTMEKL